MEKDRNSGGGSLGFDFEKLEEGQLFESEYSVDLSEQYFSITEDKTDICFMFTDHLHSCIYLYPKTEDVVDRWAMHFKRHCILTNLYDCVEIDELITHSPSYNVGPTDADLPLLHQERFEIVCPQALQQAEVAGLNGRNCLTRLTSLKRCTFCVFFVTAARATSSTCTTFSKQTRPSSL